MVAHAFSSWFSVSSRLAQVYIVGSRMLGLYSETLSQGGRETHQSPESMLWVYVP